MDNVGVEVIYYIGGALLAGAGLLGLALLRGYVFEEPLQEHTPEANPA